jgi:hypothetical protein
MAKLEEIATKMKKYALDHPRLGDDIKPYQITLRGGLVLTCQYLHKEQRYLLSMTRPTIFPSFQEIGVCKTAFTVPDDKVEFSMVPMGDYRTVRLKWKEPMISLQLMERSNQ